MFPRRRSVAPVATVATAAPLATVASLATAAPLATVAIVARRLLLALAFAAVVGPHAFAQSEDARYGGELRFAVIGDIDNMDAIFAPSGIGVGTAMRLVYNGLALLDPATNEYQPRLAESWEILDGGLRWRFHLRHGVLFHNGEEMTSADVKYTFDVARDPDSGSPYTSRFDDVTDVIAVDPYTLDITLSSPVLPALATSVWEHYIYPKSVYEADQAGFADHPVGTGPFIPVEWERGLQMVLKRNEDYFLGRPYFEKVTLRVMPEPAARILALEAGELDLVMDVAFEDVPRLRADPSLHLFATGPNNIQFISFFWDDPLVGGEANKTIRHALAYAIDEGAVLALYDEVGGAPSKNILPPSIWGYNDDVPTYDYDPERALELFAQEGWKRDADGALRNAAGEQFTLTLLTTPDRLGMLDAAQVIQQSLQDVGIAVHIDSYEFTTYFEDMRTGNYQARVARRNDVNDPDKLRTYFHSTNIPAQNRGWYRNDRVDELLQAGLSEQDTAARKQLYLEAQAILADDLPAYALAATPAWLASRSDIVLPDDMSLSHMVDVTHYVWRMYRK